MHKRYKNIQKDIAQRFDKSYGIAHRLVIDSVPVFQTEANKSIEGELRSTRLSLLIPHTLRSANRNLRATSNHGDISMKFGLRVRILVSVLASLFFPVVSPCQTGSTQLLSNTSFEDVANGQAVGWNIYGSGYSMDNTVAHSGSWSVKLSNTDTSSVQGIEYSIVLNQAAPAPVVASVWNKAQSVSGSNDWLYSIYADIYYADGTNLWGDTVGFDTGTHDWEQRKLFINKNKPIAQINLYFMLNQHSGTVWFDDASAITFSNPFDAQAVAAPQLTAAAKGGWFARDVAANSPIYPLVPGVENSTLHLLLKSVNLQAGGKVETATLQDTSGKDRAVTLYYVEKFQDSNLAWWQDIRTKVPITASTQELNNWGSVTGGAIDSISIYPIACVTGSHIGRVVGSIVETPRVVRTGFNAPSGLLYVAFDLGLTGTSVYHSFHGYGTIDVGVVHYNTDSTWGFRSAMKTYYGLFPQAFKRRNSPDGIWLPFTDPATIANVQDFGIKYHEINNQTVTPQLLQNDNALGIVPFRYSEPDDYGIQMASTIPQTYDNALSSLQQAASSGDLKAQAVLDTGMRDESGNYILQFESAPWLHGANWLLNDNPLLPWSDTYPSGASLVYTPQIADSLYGPNNQYKPGILGGEYIDSMENHPTILDYGGEAVKLSASPTTFSNTNYRPVVPDWMSKYDLLAYMSQDLHSRGKLFMANQTPVNHFIYAFLLDAMGIEANWNSGGAWSPESDATMVQRRTMCYHKPYLLLQNTDFTQFGPTQVQKYFERSMFYGVFPSFFSADAADSPYWEQPDLYNRDRPAFEEYIPVIQHLSAAGWEPITYAATNQSSVYIERFGSNNFTLLNDSASQATATVSIQLANLICPLGGTIQVKDLVTGEIVATVPAAATISFPVTVASQSAVALQLTPSGSTTATNTY